MRGLGELTQKGGLLNIKLDTLQCVSLCFQNLGASLWKDYASLLLSNLLEFVLPPTTREVDKVKSVVCVFNIYFI